MKTPLPTQTANGDYNIRLRLKDQNGKRINVHVVASTKSECTRKATLIKAEFRATGRLSDDRTYGSTVHDVIRAYIDSLSNVRSPSTIKGYEAIIRTRWLSIAQRDVTKISPQEWQNIVNREAGLCSPKTLKNGWSLLHAAIEFQGYPPPKVKLPRIGEHDTSIVEPKDIPRFIEFVSKDPEFGVPLLLALSSLRMSEIDGLFYDNVKPDGTSVFIRQVRIHDKTGKLVYKPYGKSKAAEREVPICCKELQKFLAENWAPGKKVMSICQKKLRNGFKEYCNELGLPQLRVHDLRHSFASLCFYLRIPQQVVKKIGGWEDSKVLNNIYTHLTDEEFIGYDNKMRDFYR